MLDYELPFLSATVLSWIAAFATSGRVRTHALRLGAFLTTIYIILFQPDFLVYFGFLKPLQAEYIHGFQSLFFEVVGTNETLAQTSLFTTSLSFVLHYIKPRQRELVMLKYALAIVAGFLWFSIFISVFKTLGPFPVN